MEKDVKHQELAYYLGEQEREERLMMNLVMQIKMKKVRYKVINLISNLAEKPLNLYLKMLQYLF